MITWRDVTVGETHLQDLRSRAEKKRLIRQVRADSGKPGVWQNISNLVFRVNQKRQPVMGKTQTRKQNHLAEEAV